MDIRSHYLSLSAHEREAMASACQTTLGHLRNVAYGKACGETLAMNIDRYTAGKVTCEELRPDLAEQWAFLRNSRRPTENHPNKEAA